MEKLKVAQRGSGVYTFKILKSHHGQHALGGPARAEGLNKTTSGSPFQSQSLCEIVITCTQWNTTLTVHVVLNIKKAGFQVKFQSNWFREKKQIFEFSLEASNQNMDIQ